jgi:hypothetical protein
MPEILPMGWVTGALALFAKPSRFRFLYDALARGFPHGFHVSHTHKKTSYLCVAAF